MKAKSLHIKSYIFRGLLALIPISLTVIALKLVYVYVDRTVVGFVDDFTGLNFPGAGLILFLLLLYLTGLLTSHFLGKRFFTFLDKLAHRLPIVRTTYKVGQQLVSTLSLPEKEIFRRAVLVEYLKPGMWTLGFVTGKLNNEADKETLLKVFVPTPPNPLSGTMIVVREAQVHDPGWSVDEAIRTIVSGGLIGPETVTLSAHSSAGTGSSHV